VNIAAIFDKYLSGQETGQLVVKFADVKHLCKVSIDHGQAVYIGLGTLGPEETIDFIIDKTPLQANFIPGVPPRKKLSAPLNETLMAIANTQAGLQGEAPVTAKPASEPKAQEDGAVVAAAAVEAAIDDFIEAIGPLGMVIAENCTTKMGYSKGSPMAGDKFGCLLDCLSGEIPEEQKDEFLSKHKK